MASKSNLIDLTNQKFGKLTVISRVGQIGERSQWLCKCDCGSTAIIFGSNLKNGHTTSCGCIKSIGENLISQFLNELNINYIKEHTFSNLPNRRFDFYLPKNNLCIEYDGKQHFYFVGTWHKTEEEFQKSIQRDKEKNEYCQKNNIRLIRIPYTDLNKINKEYLLNLLNMEEAQEGEV